MRDIYILFSKIGWGWAAIVFAFLLLTKGKGNGDREDAKNAKEAAKEI
jgi:hypothetical protein